MADTSVIAVTILVGDMANGIRYRLFTAKVGHSKCASQQSR